jgi:hypothetical protein
MPDQVCCVCGDPGVSMISQRWFCEKHFNKASRERPHTWRSSILLVVGLGSSICLTCSCILL